MAGKLFNKRFERGKKVRVYVFVLRIFSIIIEKSGLDKRLNTEYKKGGIRDDAGLA